jgi:hypothetical protein
MAVARAWDCPGGGCKADRWPTINALASSTAEEHSANALCSAPVAPVPPRTPSGYDESVHLKADERILDIAPHALAYPIGSARWAWRRLH